MEPAPAMRAERPPQLPPAIDAVAEALPFDDGSFDAAMAVLTVHQWADAPKGLSELRRVARGPVVIVTFDGGALDRFWLADYVPELIELERRRFPAIVAICSALGSDVHVAHLSVPVDCLDGFNEAFYARPERFLDEDVRGAQSAWALVGPDIETRFVSSLHSDLSSGAWDRRYGEWRSRPAFDGALRLIVGRR